MILVALKSRSQDKCAFAKVSENSNQWNKSLLNLK